MRFTTLLLCLILAAAAAGRYRAETAVRNAKSELQQLDRAKAATMSEIQLLRAEIAYLESPERLAAIAERATSLEPLSGAQLMTAEDFRLAFGEISGEFDPLKTAEDVVQPVAVADMSE